MIQISPDVKIIGKSLIVSPGPNSREAAQTETANTLIQKTLMISLDAGIPADVLENLLLYFWFAAR